MPKGKPNKKYTPEFKKLVVETWTIVNKVDTKKENKKEKVKF